LSIFIIELAVILVLILINGFLSMSEMAMVSSKRARLMELANKGNSGAKLVLNLLDRSSEFLASIQVGITLVGVLAGTFSGATMSEKISQYLSYHYPSIARYSDAIGVFIIVVVITYLSLILGELVPKRIALNSPESIATRVAKIIRLVSSLTRPLVWLLTISTETVLKVFGFKKSNEPIVTEEEVRIMIEQGTEAGVFEKNEESMLKKVMLFTDLRAKDVMTPRVSMVAINLNDPRERILQTIVQTGHSYYPVFSDSLDNLTGLLSGKLMLERVISEGLEGLQFEDCVTKEPLFIPNSMSAGDLLEKFKTTKKHVAIVIDEFGGVSGLISIIDILESIVGNVPDDSHKTVESAIRRKDGSWLIDGLIPIHQISELTGFEVFGRKKTNGVFTLAGLFMQELERVPKEGDALVVGQFRLEVVDMDGNKVDKVLLQDLSSVT
jgi:putative hemolysin